MIGDYLFEHYPGKDEGFLSQLRAKVVNREFFNDLGYKLELDQWIRETISFPPDAELAPSMVGNAFEALFGAIFLDKGYKEAKRFFEKVILVNHLDIESLKTVETNYKSRLLEWGQKYGKSVEFNLVNTNKEGNNLLFIIEVLIEGEPSGIGQGLKKKKAEQQAAKHALQELNLL